MGCILIEISASRPDFSTFQTSGTRTETNSSDHLKIVGFNFNSAPSVSHHVRTVCKKFRAALWSLRELRDAGMNQEDLIYIYSTVLRPVIEFACVTYGPMLTNDLSLEIERLQLRAAKIAYGPYVSYSTVLRETDLDTLESRRNTRIRRFAEKTLSNPRFASRWFPLSQKHQHDTRHTRKFLEENARTSRLYNSPLFTMRRILNGNFT